MFSEDELKEMEKYAAEMKVVKVTIHVRFNSGVCDAISIGLGKNKWLKHVTVNGCTGEENKFLK